MIPTSKSFCLHWPVFLAAFGLGILYIYFSSPPPKIVFKFPSPYNAGKVIYRDKSDECFIFEATKVECPAHPKKQPTPQF